VVVGVVVVEGEFVIDRDQLPCLDLWLTLPLSTTIMPTVCTLSRHCGDNPDMTQISTLLITLQNVDLQPINTVRSQGNALNSEDDAATTEAWPSGPATPSRGQVSTPEMKLGKTSQTPVLTTCSALATSKHHYQILLP
jgi:hypothetical protein